jgi:hypothetical protein
MRDRIRGRLFTGLRLGAHQQPQQSSKRNDMKTPKIDQATLDAAENYRKAQQRAFEHHMYMAALQGVCANENAKHDTADQAALYAFEAANAMMKLIREQEAKREKIGNPNIN